MPTFTIHVIDNSHTPAYDYKHYIEWIVYAVSLLRLNLVH